MGVQTRSADQTKSQEHTQEKQGKKKLEKDACSRGEADALKAAQESGSGKSGAQLSEEAGQEREAKADDTGGSGKQGGTKGGGSKRAAKEEDGGGDGSGENAGQEGNGGGSTDGKEADGGGVPDASGEPEPKRQATEAKKQQQAAADAAAAPDASHGDRPESVVEEGRVYFIVRPKVSTEHPHSVDDLQRFFLILAPAESEGRQARLIAIGKKRLPAARKHERFFGFVYTVANEAEELMKGLGAEKYETKTRGTREKPGARVVGEGVYAIEHAGGGATKLAYELELPQETGEAQRELNIGKRAALLVSIKNPETGNPVNAGLKEKAEYSKEQLETFAHASEATMKHMDEEEHAEVAKALREAKAADKAGDEEHAEQALLAKLEAELHASQAGVNVTPAAEGHWE